MAGRQLRAAAHTCCLHEQGAVGKERVRQRGGERRRDALQLALVCRQRHAVVPHWSHKRRSARGSELTGSLPLARPPPGRRPGPPPLTAQAEQPRAVRALLQLQHHRMRVRRTSRGQASAQSAPQKRRHRASQGNQRLLGRQACHRCATVHRSRALGCGGRLRAGELHSAAGAAGNVTSASGGAPRCEHSSPVLGAYASWCAQLTW